MVRRWAGWENRTDDEALDDIATPKAVGDLDLVLFCRADVLCADHAIELFSGWKGDAIDDGYGDDGVEGREACNGAQDEGVGCGRVWSLSVYGRRVVREGACEAGAELAVLEVESWSERACRRPHRRWLSWQEERHK